MSDEITKAKRSRRLLKDKVKAKRQYKIAKNYDSAPKTEHFYEKRHAMTCGNSNCVMCGNPRKFWGKKTIQEYKFEEESLIIEE